MGIAHAGLVSQWFQGEISKFTVPEMYRTGGPQQFLAKLPDDGEEVVYEIELVPWPDSWRARLLAHGRYNPSSPTATLCFGCP